MVTAPQLGVIGDELDAPKVTIVPIENDHAILPGNVRVPLNPMVGVIGVAPAGKPSPAARRIATAAIWTAK
jgi:amidase